MRTKHWLVLITVQSVREELKSTSVSSAFVHFLDFAGHFSCTSSKGALVVAQPHYHIHRGKVK